MPPGMTTSGAAADEFSGLFLATALQMRVKNSMREFFSQLTLCRDLNASKTGALDG